MKKYSLAIHGGAGTLLKSEFSLEKETEYNKALQDALARGNKILTADGSALDAVEASVKSMEDSPLFNAGFGSVFTNEETHELEASIMCGKSLQAGAVAGIRTIKNPISLCKKILKDERFVYLIGKGAERYGQDHDFETVHPEYFSTKFRKNQLDKAKEDGEKIVLDHNSDRKFGTVGAVAKDQSGNVAAATSTGGLTNKMYGRVGDSSVIGSGCFADNNSCAISATGYGEFFLRNVTAHEISSLMKYRKLSVLEASEIVVKEQLKEMGGEGGVICVDAKGNLALVFNSEGMYRGWVSDQEEMQTRIFID